MKDVIGYEGIYSVDVHGKIYSHKSKKFLSAKKSPDRGYFHVSLYKDNTVRNFDVHRLVALSYIPNPDNKPQVNHINRKREDNSVENLEWVTAKENVAHSFKIGERKIPKGESHCFFGKPAHNRKMIMNVTTGEIFESLTKAAKKLNILRECVRDCLKGRQKTAGGFQFIYHQE